MAVENSELAFDAAFPEDNIVKTPKADSAILDSAQAFDQVLPAPTGSAKETKIEPELGNIQDIIPAIYKKSTSQDMFDKILPAERGLTPSGFMTEPGLKPLDFSLASVLSEFPKGLAASAQSTTGVATGGAGEYVSEAVVPWLMQTGYGLLNFPERLIRSVVPGGEEQTSTILDDFLYKKRTQFGFESPVETIGAPSGPLEKLKVKSRAFRQSLIEASNTGWEAPPTDADATFWLGDWLPRMSRIVGEAVPSYGVALGATLLTKNPAAGAAILGSQQGLSTYTNARDAGVPIDQASTMGLLSGGWSMATERLPFDLMLGAAGKAALVRAFKGSLTEGLQEVIQEVGINAIEKFGYDEGRKITQNWLESLVAGGVLGSGGGLISGAISNNSKVQNSANEMVDTMEEVSRPSIGEQLEFDLGLEGGVGTLAHKGDILSDTDDPMILTERAIHDWEGGVNEGILIADQNSKAIANKLKEANISPERQKAIIQAIEDPGGLASSNAQLDLFAAEDKIASQVESQLLPPTQTAPDSAKNASQTEALKASPTAQPTTPDSTEVGVNLAAKPKFGVKGLSDAEVEVMNWYKDLMRQGKELAQSEGLLDDTLENYVTHMYEESPKEIRKVVQQGHELNPNFRFSESREIPSLREGEALGLTPVYDLPLLVRSWWRAFSKAKTNKKLITTLKTMRGKDGDPVLSMTEKPGYTFLNQPALARWFYTNDDKGKNLYQGRGVYVHPDFAESVSTVTEPFDLVANLTNEKISKGYKKLRAGVKRLVMFNPLVHGWNIFSDGLDELNFNVLKSIKTTFKGVGEKEITSMWGEGGREALHTDMAKNGVNLDATRNAQAALGQTMDMMFPELASKATPLNFVGKLGAKSDKFLWGKIVQNWQEIMYMRVKGRAIEKGFSDKRAGVLAADFTNSNLGTLSKTLFTPTSSEFLNTMLFARNWTISNLRLMTGALGMKQNWVPRTLRQMGYTKAEMHLLQKEYSDHLIKGVMALQLLGNAVNYFTSGMDWDELEWKPEKAKLMWQNEKGHKLDIDMGVRGKRGERLYVVPPLFRYIRDSFQWFNPLEWDNILFNKMEPVLKQTMEQLSNYSFWKKSPIVQNGATFLQGMGDRLDYAARGLTPIGSYSSRNGQVRTGVEKLAPVLGTWIRRGMTGGDSGLLLQEFMSAKKYENGKLSKEIDELIQGGDIAGGVEKMIKEKGMSSVKSVIGNIQKFKTPLAYKLSILSKQDRLEFWSSMTPEQKEQFDKDLKLK